MRWNCNGRLNYVTPEVLRLMKKAGCDYINYGIEAMDNTVLKNMKKGLNTDQVVKAVMATKDAGIFMGLNMMFGNIGDNRETLKAAVDFLVEHDDCNELRTIRPVTPYPGSPLYYDAIEKGLLEGVADFYENKHTNSDLLCCNFTELSDVEFYEVLTEANKRLICNYYEKSQTVAFDQIDHLYSTRDASFRGFRQI